MHWWPNAGRDLSLITSSSQGTPAASAGILGLTSTSELLNNRTLTADPMNGGRVTFGIWADDDRFQAWEASYFGLRSDSHYANASTGKTILARPYFDALSGNSPAKLLAAHPTFLSGDVRIDYSLQFQGAEVGIRSRLVENAGNRFDLLLAYRYLDSDEQSRFESSLRYTTAQGAILAGTTKDIIDQFQT